MTSKLEEHHNPLTPQEFARILRRSSRWAFWLQLGLAVVSIAILVFAIADPNFNLKSTNPMSGVGLFFAFSGLLVLGIGIYSAFSYTRVAEQLNDFNGGVHLKKSEVIHVLWRGLFINAVGVILTLLGVESIVGTLIAKSLTQVEGLAIYNSSQLIEPLDLLVIQANVNTIVAQVMGILLAAWLISRIGRH
jgi:hypothetical protein